MSGYDRTYSHDGGRYEMSSLGASRSNDNLVSRGGGGRSMEAFYDEISSVQETIRTFNANVLKISELHTRSLNSMDESAAKRFAAQLEELMAETSALSAELKQRIKALERQGGSGPDGQARATQTAFVKSKFVESIQGYQQVEREYRSKYKQRIERQFKIVKPDATPEEVKAVVESDDAQVFTQDLMNSNRLGQSRAAYQEVQARHADIKKIEKTLIELAELFNDMSLAVEQQDEQIDDVLRATTQIDVDIEKGLEQTTIAVNSAAGARRKRWICLWISVVIIIVIVIIVIVQLHPWRQ